MKKDLKYRFDEIITTINLLPDNPTDEDREGEGMVFPNLTRDLHEPELYTAILCQTFKSGKTDEDFTAKMCATLANSAMESMMNSEEAPTDDDLYALAVAANIAWASDAGMIMLKMLAMLSMITEKFDLEIPDLALAMFKSSAGVEKFGELDPYRILDKDYTPLEMAEVAIGKDKINPEMAEILELLRQIRENE